MENADTFDIETRCESPVYVETSPVSSPVFVSKHTEQHTNLEYYAKIDSPSSG